MWDLCCSDADAVAIAAPREHAKSTAITHAYTLANVMFREVKYVLIIGATESQASLFLADIKSELLENEKLIEIFGIRKMTKDSVTDIIVEMNDGHKFRITAQGAEQKVRGKKWGGGRPGLIICDDIEEDEAVESDERREKFLSWFLKALLPSIRRGGKIRIVGTILHMDSLLSNLMKNESWTNLFYKAHKSFDNFSDLLWPDQWSEERLKKRRAIFINAGNPEGYAQEYLNNPVDQSEAYFRGADLIPMEEGDYTSTKNYYAGLDLAISDRDKRAYTVMIVGGMDSNNILHIINILRFRGDADEIISNMLALQKRYNILAWKCERGQISMSIKPALIHESITQNIPIMLDDETAPMGDKRARARSIQQRLRSGSVKIDKKADWYLDFEEEMLYFPKGTYKDQVDAMAWLGIGINDLSEGPTEEEEEEEEYNEFSRGYNRGQNRNQITGY